MKVQDPESVREAQVPAEPEPGWLRRPTAAVVFGFVAVALGVAGAIPMLRGPKVKTVAVARRALVQRVIATGRVEPPARVNLGSQVAGVAVRVGPEEGDRVKAGALLFELDASEMQATVEQAQAGVAAAMARLVQLKGTGSLIASESVRQSEITLLNAEANLARLEALFKSSAVTQKDLDDARKQADLARSQQTSSRLQAASAAPGGGDVLLAQANLSQAQAILAQARARLAQMKILAPADGIILSRGVEPGDIVQPGKVLFVLARDGRTRLVAQPDEKSLAYLAVGQRALASVDAFPAQTFPATITTLAPSVDPSRGTIEVKLDVPAPPAYLRADMTVSVDVEVAKADAALVLPAEVVQDVTTPKPWVWIVDSDKLARRSVTLGLKGEGFVQVVAGLVEGQAVVAAEGKPLKAGTAVRGEPPS